MISGKREDILKQVKELVLKSVEKTPARIYLFGSWARGDERATSDIDIAVEPIGAILPFLLQNLREELEESHIPYNVDAVDTREADSKLIDNIMKEGILWRDC